MRTLDVEGLEMFFWSLLVSKILLDVECIAPCEPGLQRAVATQLLLGGASRGTWVKTRGRKQKSTCQVPDLEQGQVLLKAAGRSVI